MTCIIRARYSNCGAASGFLVRVHKFLILSSTAHAHSAFSGVLAPDSLLRSWSCWRRRQRCCFRWKTRAWNGNQKATAPAPRNGSIWWVWRRRCSRSSTQFIHSVHTGVESCDLRCRDPLQRTRHLRHAQVTDLLQYDVTHNHLFTVHHVRYNLTHWLCRLLRTTSRKRSQCFDQILTYLDYFCCI